MLKILVTVILTFVVVFTFSPNAVADECSSLWSSDHKLSEDLKNILINEISIPVQSPDIIGTDENSQKNATLRNLIVSYQLRKQATLETGSKLDPSTLDSANGYALVDFSIDNLSQIAKIHAYLQEKYGNASSFIKLDDVSAKLVFKNKTGKEVGSRKITINQGKNRVDLCNQNFKDITSIEIKLESFQASFSDYHKFT